jgi:hypothetical protein
VLQRLNPSFFSKTKEKLAKSVYLETTCSETKPKIAYLSIVAADSIEVTEFNLGAQRAEHYRLHVRDGEAVRAQVTQHLKT